MNTVDIVARCVTMRDQQGHTMRLPDTVESVKELFNRSNRRDMPKLDRIITTMVSRPNPWTSQLFTPRDAWNTILDYHIALKSGKSGWIDPHGELWTIASHSQDLLAYWLNVTSMELLKSGWVSVNDKRYNHNHTLTPKQLLTLNSMGVIRS